MIFTKICLEKGENGSTNTRRTMPTNRLMILKASTKDSMLRLLYLLKRRKQKDYKRKKTPRIKRKRRRMAPKKMEKRRRERRERAMMKAKFKLQKWVRLRSFTNLMSFTKSIIRSGLTGMKPKITNKGMTLQWLKMK